MSSIGDQRNINYGTRYGIVFATIILASFMKMPTQEHLKLLHYTIGYFSHTKSQGLHFKATNTDPLRSYTYSDYCDYYDHCSTSGTIHLSYGTPVLWSSKKNTLLHWAHANLSSLLLTLSFKAQFGFDDYFQISLIKILHLHRCTFIIQAISTLLIIVVKHAGTNNQIKFHRFLFPIKIGLL